MQYNAVLFVMIRIIQYIFLCSSLLFSSLLFSQDTNSVQLHMQLFDQGICLPMLESDYYSTSQYQNTKSVFKVGAYYSTIHVYIDSPDSANLFPKTNHQLQAGSLKFNPKKDYQLVIVRSVGFNRNSPDSMVIKISKLEKDAQLIIPFQKGTFTLHKMKYYKELNAGESANFVNEESLPFKINLKIDTTTYYTNGNKKANYYKFAPNFPLYFVQEFDSLYPNKYAQGFHLMTNYPKPNFSSFSYSTIWNNPNITKYGYWEYFENEKRLGLEMWASFLQQKYEWYPSWKIKYESNFGQTNKLSKHTVYLENGAIKEEFWAQTHTQRSEIKSYVYSPEGTIILIKTYDSNNGITKQGLTKRELFYPSGKRKMVEVLGNNYNIKYYNEDGKESGN